jgi:NADPH-dependent glutamate synthase beta subunit-like oxidoreductase/Pyruvate/2-oxoacid:ferredoxin oxidoreductase delta subunit
MIMTKLKHIDAIRNGDLSGLPVSWGSTAVNMTGSWKFFRPTLKPKDSPCLEACPLHIAIAEYMQEFGAGNHLEALEILRRNNPMPAVTGRVCPNFCQSACNRKNFDEAVLIGDIERALGDLGLTTPHPDSTQECDKKVAVIGSGPAGLAAAFFLARYGIKVTIFEKHEAPGGLLRYGIPAYRLPRQILAQEIENIINSGSIEIKCNHPVTAADVTKLDHEFDQVIAAPGLSQSSIPKPWQKFPNVKGALDILAAISRDEQIAGQNFIVIGGGNAALDAARSLKRIGKDVKIIYRRTIAEMPAYPEEIQEALEEGLSIETEMVVGKVLTDSQNGLQLDLHRSQKSGDKIVPGDFLETISCDSLVTAIGQESSIDFIDCNPARLKAGDFAHGAASVAEALASGRKAAASALHKFALLPINDTDHQTPQDAQKPAPVTYEALHLNYYAKKPAIKIPQLNKKNRADNFAEIRSGLTLEQLECEAGRCFSCGSCTTCGICWFFCPDVAIAINHDGDADQPQILFDYDHCKGCGQCAEVCPRGVIELEEDL